ncbi:MAG: Nif3-like dinuclear metal center hexameric protein [Firmicutes bacterium]|nr:Nif3-like dinuclear metal center hexameric protein [Bacillota bacterium]
MLVSITDITGYMEKIFPPSLAEDWDNVGLQVGAPCVACRTILICLTVTESVVDYAVEAGVDLIIAHHPLIFTPLKSIVFGNMSGRIISKMLTHHISLYVAHTNADQASGGLNDWLAETLGLQDITMLPKPDHPVDNAGEENYGCFSYGRIGMLAQPKKLDQFVGHVKQALQLEHIRFAGNEARDIEKVAVSCGSGAHLWQDALKAGCDVLVTGDVKFHTAVDVEATSMAIVDAGHFGTEAVFTHHLAELLEKEAKTRNWSLRVIPYSKERDPWKGA